jgi:signal transduction histidine kinase
MDLQQYFTGYSLLFISMIFLIGLLTGILIEYLYKILLLEMQGVRSRSVERVKSLDRSANFKTDFLQLANQAKPRKIKIVRKTPQQLQKDEDAIEAERIRLKNALHDNTVQQLVAFRFQLEELQLWVLNDIAKRNIDRMMDELDRTINSLRHLIYNIVQPDIENKTLAELVKEMADKMSQSVLLKVYLHEIKPEKTFELTLDEKMELYSILQESFQNALKYSQANQFHVHMDWTDGLVFEIEDNGVGISASSKFGSGIESMKERAAKINAAIRFESGVKTGFVVTVTIANRSDEQSLLIR